MPTTAVSTGEDKSQQPSDDSSMRTTNHNSFKAEPALLPSPDVGVPRSTIATGEAIEFAFIFFNW